MRCSCAGIGRLLPPECQQLEEYDVWEMLEVDLGDHLEGSISLAWKNGRPIVTFLQVGLP